MPNAPCPMPHAPCPMPNAQCPMIIPALEGVLKVPKGIIFQFCTGLSAIEGNPHIVINCSGRGYKDVQTVAKVLIPSINCVSPN